jgi:heme/copper-type cytochrome/quinol oxidase subunit 2
MYKKSLFMGVIIVALSLVLVACGGGASSAPAGVSLTLKAQDIKFDLKEIKAKVNQPVNITFVSEGTVEHTFVIVDLGVKETVQPGQKKVITFTPNKTGTFKFICDVLGHTEAGMVGQLIVEP